VVDNLSFVLERRELPVTIDGEGYVLRELDGRERDKYLNSLNARLKVTAGGGQSVKDFDGMQASLVAASLFKIVGSEREPVTVDEVQGWPARVSATLFDAAKKLSGLGGEDETDEGDEGND
jgi:hypothetical protein